MPGVNSFGFITKLTNWTRYIKALKQTKGKSGGSPDVDKVVA